ncbi:hypothetical protein Spith_1234 [Spirochaeta thermophila DSM 6578]|uniref:Uncharacterized protein n=1 Tax=Winmispira thermophila (strain ATCC 700085 / DSM 6578 / Z-1203) TaxID=869211 RepID=G0GEU4_WINT7|nr:hypothetical protein [Spirochaeta thermophila]AEJ61500.1 hypothetical protein Spith_1234 [Spirochaeta thermophila DSM 6578]
MSTEEGKRQTDEFRRLVEAYFSRFRHTEIPFNHFAAYAIREAQRNRDEFPSFSALTSLESLSREVVRLAKPLEREGMLIVDADPHGTINMLYYLSPYYERIEAHYQEMSLTQDLPFPDTGLLGISLSERFFLTLSVKDDFLHWFERHEETGEGNTLIRLTFPDGLPVVVITERILLQKLCELCVIKLRAYLTNERNSAYLLQKIRPFFRQNETMLRNMLHAALTRTDQTLREIREPSDTVYYFWNQLANFLYKDIISKKDRQEVETSYCHAAYLLTYFLLYYKSKVRKKKEKERALQILERQLKKRPYAFTLGEILSFTDDRGIPLLKFCERNDIVDHVKEHSTAPDPLSLPPLVKLKGADDQDYYIRRELLLPVFEERRFLLSMELKREYTNQWYLFLKKDEELPEMFDDEEFARDVRERVARKDPVFPGFLQFHLLYLAWEGTDLPAAQKGELQKIFDERNRRLRPLPEILDLDREKLLKDARLMLPFWKVIPVVSTIIRFLKRLFLGKPARPHKKKKSLLVLSPSSAPPRQKAPPVPTDRGEASLPPPTPASQPYTPHQFRARIQELTKAFLPPGMRIDEALESLIERWNPLIDEESKEILVEDVNNFAKDFLRKMRILNRRRPPTKEQIRTMAQTLSENKAFERIKEKEAFREYLELYMLKILGKL